MKIQATVTKEFNILLLIVEAQVRYWEDAEVNGVDDDGELIPFREGDLWKPVIDIEAGIIRNWPKDTCARIHYSYYVPDRLLCVGDHGFGDYIILNVNGLGGIEGWRSPEIDGDEWEAA